MIETVIKNTMTQGYLCGKGEESVMWVGQEVWVG